MEIYAFMGPGTRLGQVFAFCAITDASAHSLPIHITAFSQKDSLWGAGPWSQHISLMLRSVELLLTPSPAWHSSLPDRQTDNYTDTQSLASSAQSGIFRNLLASSSAASNWHQLWTAVSCGKDVSVPVCFKNSALKWPKRKMMPLCICAADFFFPFPHMWKYVGFIYLALAISTACAHD